MRPKRPEQVPTGPNTCENPDKLAKTFEIVAPVHPGFAGSEIPEHFDDMQDLIYLYLDLMDELDLRDAIMMGFSMGGWTAAELAVLSTARISNANARELLFTRLLAAAFIRAARTSWSRVSQTTRASRSRATRTRARNSTTRWRTRARCAPGHYSSRAS